ncbi:MAG: dipeptide epimerase [Caulobacter sp.]|jgi:L-alanine-DL-glutamate epimerase-like enolase superfamily enzyme|nr:dipeptide epimerase [Caulobacter sp.]
MLRNATVRRQRWPLKAPFRISRGVKTAAETVIVQLRRGEACGRGESAPYPRYGESADGVLGQLAPVLAAFEAGEDDAAVLAMLPAGAARNALDCALWDLKVRETGVSVAAMTGLARPASLVCAVTISLDEPEVMATAARASAEAPLIKIKLDADRPEERLLAVAGAAPNSRFIVDPNEGWTRALLDDLRPLLARLPIALIEQPLPADADGALEGFDPPAPVCADESLHTADDLDRLKGRYQAVNIKLDKTGGLTEAIHTLRAARAAGFQVMTGCMVASSLAIAPALHIAGASDFVDLDGPWWLAGDWPAGVRLQGGVMRAPAAGFWGEPA